MAALVSKLAHRLRKSLREDIGSDVAEYAILLGLVAVVLVVSVRGLGIRLASLFGQAADQFTGGSTASANLQSVAAVGQMSFAGHTAGTWVVVATVVLPAAALAGMSWWRRG